MNQLQFKVNVSVIIKNDNKEVLLLKRSETEEVFPSFWGIPGGTVEQTDISLEAALERECQEEVNIEITDIKLISNNINNRKGKGGALYLVYEARHSSGIPTPLDGTAEVKWLNIDQIRKLELTPMTLELIESCQ